MKMDDDAAEKKNIEDRVKQQDFRHLRVGMMSQRDPTQLYWAAQ
jgi:hypothetical protein